MKALLGILAILLWIGTSCRPAKQAETEASHQEVGPGKAVLAAEPERGFQLSEAALQTLGIRWQALAEGPEFQAPLSSVVFHQADTGVYRLDRGWFHLVPVTLRSSLGDTAKMTSEELRPGDLIVIRGAEFLRVTELELFGESSNAHAH